MMMTGINEADPSATIAMTNPNAPVLRMPRQP
jgi:hypothetical protein